jgi:hypothetical protein
VTVTIDIGEIGAARADAALEALRGVKAWYEQTAEKRLKSGAMTLGQVSERLQPIGDAINICGMVSLAIAEAEEPGLDELSEYADLAADLPKTDLAAGCKAVAKENEEACGDCRIPKCRFCGNPGTRAGGIKNASGRTVERYYVCETPDCVAAQMKVPQPAKLFAGGEA